MKYFNKLFILIFLLPIVSIAQSNYKPGYVVDLKGDTIRGFIDLQEWDSSPTAISFKPVISAPKPQKLTVSDITFFNVDGLAIYKKYTSSISTDETNIAHLGTSRDTSYRVAPVFLKILQKGKNVALYQYTDDLKTRFYIGEA